jgi:hypothetical protein
MPMNGFPRTEIDGVSVPRMLIGTNWFLGFSHFSRARDEYIRSVQTRETLADILEVFFAAGIDCVYGTRPEATPLEGAIRDAEDRTGRECIRLSIPTLDTAGTPEAHDANARTLDEYAAIGTRICMPHQCTTDAMLDRRDRTIRGLDRISALIRERGMVPGISTHTPEAAIYADEQGFDVQCYCQIYNAAGFLMHVEVDWTQRMIWQRAKPVIAIKPFAAGRLHPLVGLAFCYATLRPQDMVCVGTLTADEARELIEIAGAIFEGRCPTFDLQTTRSKATLASK